MEITTDFCGGNAVITDICEDRVTFKPDQRDTAGEWFYWAFGVTGAQGTTVTFDLASKPYVGRFGAAVSEDLLHWRWSSGAFPDQTGFTYTFGNDEKRVYFAHHMLYLPSQFVRFCEAHRLALRSLGEDNHGTPLLYTQLGTGERRILVTARHHCCESTGNYLMEGILDEFIRCPIAGFSLIAIPFIDADGVMAGDQGKNRLPHDHNRDYTEAPRYNGVKAVKRLLDEGGFEAVFDLHAPYHSGGRNDKLFIVRKEVGDLAAQKRFGRLFEQNLTPGAMRYETADDIDPGVEWNKLGTHTTCGTYAAGIAGMTLAFTLETTYFGEPGNVVSQERLIETGRCFCRTIRVYFG